MSYCRAEVMNFVAGFIMPEDKSNREAIKRARSSAYMKLWHCRERERANTVLLAEKKMALKTMCQLPVPGFDDRKATVEEWAKLSPDLQDKVRIWRRLHDKAALEYAMAKAYVKDERRKRRKLVRKMEDAILLCNNVENCMNFLDGYDSTMDKVKTCGKWYRYPECTQKAVADLPEMPDDFGYGKKHMHIKAMFAHPSGLVYMAQSRPFLTMMFGMVWGIGTPIMLREIHGKHGKNADELELQRAGF